MDSGIRIPLPGANSYTGIRSIEGTLTVFIRISAQPRTSAHLEYAPILKAEKFNKRPPPPHLPPPQTQISAHPLSRPCHQKNLK